ncbi:hypothetical protein ACTG9Q_23750 [Actinokineospora sp. 24-640]
MIDPAGWWILGAMRRGRALAAAALMVLASACGSARDDALAFTRVDLPPGATPTAVGGDGGGLLVGVRWADRAVLPGLIRLAADGGLAEIPLTPATPYGRIARWTSVAGDGERVLAVGGERGGAHGNVRWSVWTGSGTGVSEHRQGFSVFGGYGAGDLIGGVLTPAGPVVVGAWESARAALDVAVWTMDAANLATRRSSAGTALESSREQIGFPMTAAAFGGGVLIAGWQVQSGDGPSGQAPVVWRSAAGAADWTKTVLPHSGTDATADGVSCWDSTCAVTGQVDGTLAVWQLAGGQWTPVGGVPPVPVDDRQRVAAPLRVDGGLAVAVAVAEEGRVRLLLWREGAWTAREVTGPEGAPTAITSAGGDVYLLSGPGEGTLWRAPSPSLR